MSEHDRSQDSERRYWERHAAKYDLSLRLLGRPLPRMLELIAEAVSGRARVLEVAAGTGLVTPVLAKAAGAVIATDYAAAMVDRLREKVVATGSTNVECRQADLYELPFEPGTFDAVVAANVLHLVPDISAALAPLIGMLRPGGILVAPTFCHDETRLSDRSPIAQNMLPGSAFSACTAAPVPRPPHPTSPTLTVESLPRANADAIAGVIAAAPIPAVVLRNSRRVPMSITPFRLVHPFHRCPPAGTP